MDARPLLYLAAWSTDREANALLRLHGLVPALSHPNSYHEYTVYSQNLYFVGQLEVSSVKYLRHEQKI